MTAPLALVLAAAVVGCAPAPAVPELRIMVPNPPGGGYDTTARTVAAALEETGLAGETGVFNVPGSAGTTGLHRLLYEEGNEQLLLQMGMGLVARTHINDETPVTAATPLARLVEEPMVILVPPDSPYRTFDDLAEDWRDPGVRLTLGGGSSPGGPDHLPLMLLAEEIGVDPGKVDYAWHDGGGETLAALLQHDVDAAAAGAGEYRQAIAAGQLRVLAVSGPERTGGIDAPTLRELGFDLVFMNWRGLLAPPGISERERDALIAVLDDLHATPEWRSALNEAHWTDAYLTGDDFGAFLAAEDRDVGDVLGRLGLADR
ncbi:Bug family tripartite tricarboxylate transporter substrate binding protein [Nocardiopsis gilva]|uniref:Bug family tripartite tricarboxylate transporter substrate binding protein n=1 Tax=Nocardiopsis gilva TaxID=280236 RepID=UPI001E4B5EE3|nr:tripartite tricarboxylate transporter substrate-binding protein [Nocardiopsis gilva]